MLARVSLALAAVAAVTTLAVADRPHHGPPPKEAVDACSSKAANDTCSFSHDGHDVTGTCSTGPDGNGPLACKPDHPPGPPQAALDACANRSRGDACNFTMHDRAVAGTCDGPPDKPLACRPNDMPPRD